MGTVYKETFTKPLPTEAKIIVRKVTTGCRDKSAAESVLTYLKRRAEKVKGGILMPAEDTMIDREQTPVADHVAAYINQNTATGTSADCIRISRLRMKRLVTDCGFQRLNDMTAAAVEGR